tara:strand:+ start:1150 stop:1395 length:246 start_codon:yes stop_codon:yes gene_type:complete
MKKLMYLFVAAIMFVFTACGGGETASESPAPAIEESIDINQEVSEAVGCQVDGGSCLEDHSCCLPKEKTEESNEGSHGHSH